MAQVQRVAAAAPGRTGPSWSGLRTVPTFQSPLQALSIGLPGWESELRVSDTASPARAVMVDLCVSRPRDRGHTRLNSAGLPHPDYARLNHGLHGGAGARGELVGS